MSENKKSKAGLVVVIVAIALAIIEGLLQFMFFNNNTVNTVITFVPYVFLLICGIILMFVKIKQYGWAIVASLAAGGIITNIFVKDFRAVLIGAVLFLVCMAILIYKNLKKN